MVDAMVTVGSVPVVQSPVPAMDKAHDAMTSSTSTCMLSIADSRSRQEANADASSMCAVRCAEESLCMETHWAYTFRHLLGYSASHG